MPYIYEDEQKDEKEQSEQQIGATNQVVISQSQGSSVNPGNSKSNAQQTPTSSGSYVNSGDYLKANQNQQFGKQVAGNVQGEIDNSRTVQNQVKQDFTQEVDKSRVQYNPELVQKAVSTPTNVISSPEEKKAFQGQLNANYTGPKNLSDSSEQFTQVQNSYSDAKDASHATKSEDGRFGLLDRYYKRPDYNQGQKTLDNLLLQNDQSARNQFSKVQTEQEKHASEYGDLMGFLSDYGTNAATETLDTRSQARAALGLDDAGNITAGQGAIGSLQQDLKDRFFGYSNEQKQAYSDLLASLETGDISPEQASQLGINEGYRTYGVDVGQYVTPSSDPTLDSIASNEEHSRMAALLELAGVEGQNIFQNPELAGSYDPNQPYQLDTNSLTNAVKERENAYQYELLKKAIDLGVRNPSSAKDTFLESLNAIQAEQNYYDSDPFTLQNSDYQNFLARKKEHDDVLNRIRGQYGYDKILK